MENKSNTLLQDTLQSPKIENVLTEHLNKIHTIQIELMKSIPVMIKNASSVKQIEKLENHFTETKDQVNRLSQILSLINDKPANLAHQPNQKNNEAKWGNEDFDAHTLSNNAGFYENGSNGKNYD